MSGENLKKKVLQNVWYFFGEWKSQGEKSQLKGRIFSYHERYNAKKRVFQCSNDC